MTTVWMYYETDGDAGYYAIKLFSSREVAEIYKEEKDNAYGNIEEYQVFDESVVKQRPYENVKCPKCGGEMVSRKSRYGIFWGCKAFPECDGKRNVMGEAKEFNFERSPGQSSFKKK